MQGHVSLSICSLHFPSSLGKCLASRSKPAAHTLPAAEPSATSVPSHHLNLFRALLTAEPHIIGLLSNAPTLLVMHFLQTIMQLFVARCGVMYPEHARSTYSRSTRLPPCSYFSTQTDFPHRRQQRPQRCCKRMRSGPLGHRASQPGGRWPAVATTAAHASAPSAQSTCGTPPMTQMTQALRAPRLQSAASIAQTAAS